MAEHFKEGTALTDDLWFDLDGIRTGLCLKEIRLLLAREDMHVVSAAEKAVLDSWVEERGKMAGRLANALETILAYEVGGAALDRDLAHREALK